MCAVSFNPDDAIKGGLFTDIDATLENCRLGTFHYPSGESTFAFLADCVFDGGDKADAMWSIGDVGAWGSEDNDILDGTNGQTGLPESSNFLFMLTELVSAGFPKPKIDNKASTFNGLKAHWIRKAQPQRPGLNKPAEGRERTVLVAEKILRYPWDKDGKGGGKANKAAGGGGGRSTAASKPADDAENESAVAAAAEVLTAIVENDKNPREQLQKQWGLLTLSAPLKLESFKALDQAGKDAVRRLLKNAEFLAGLGVAIDDKGNVTLP